MSSIHRIAFTSVAFAFALTVSVNATADDPPPTEPQVDAPAPPAPPAPTPTWSKRLRLGSPGNSQVRVPDTIELVRDVVFATVEAGDDGPAFQLTMDTAFPKQTSGQPLPVIVYIHGGGYTAGSKEMGLPFAVAFAQGGYFAVTINYRLAGDARYPAAVHDCKAAIRFLRAGAEQLGIDPNRIGVWGHSAGGHLSALLATSGDVEELEGSVGAVGVSSKVQCAVTVSGPTDFLKLAEARRAGAAGEQPDQSQPGASEPPQPEQQWFGGPVRQHVDRATQASPLTHIDPADPPILLVHGTDDPIVPISQAELLNAALAAAGVEHELLSIAGSGHGIRQPRVYLQIAAFFDKHLGGKSAAALEEIYRSREAEPQPPREKTPEEE